MIHSGETRRSEIPAPLFIKYECVTYMIEFNKLKIFKYNIPKLEMISKKFNTS